MASTIFLSEETAAQQVPLFELREDARTPVQLAQDTALAAEVARVRGLMDEHNLAPEQLARLALIAGATNTRGDERPQAAPETPVQEKNWHLLPRFTVLATYNRNYASPEEIAADEGREWRAGRFEVTRFLPDSVKRWLGVQAIFMEVGEIQSRETDVARRESRMVALDAKRAEAAKRHQRQVQRRERQLADEEDAIATRAYRKAHRLEARHEAAAAATEEAASVLQEALTRTHKYPTYENEQLLARARQAHREARAAEDRLYAALVVANYIAQVDWQRGWEAYWERRSQQAARTLARHHTRPVPQPVGLRPHI